MKSWNLARLAYYQHLGRRHSQVRQVVAQLRARLQESGTAGTAGKAGSPKLTVQSPASYHNLIDEIRHKTADANRNNITRTNAYIDYFNHCPEIHWSLLAHCVSRNGGWSMTDTRGEWFPRVSTETQARQYFSFLERANWLIFQDAYPQLLLYEAGRRLGENLSFLLPAFHVSSFMQTIWNIFWTTKDSNLLTRALIINEQNYIESRVVRNDHYKITVEKSMNFRIESLLNLNQVLIPYLRHSEVRLSGTTVRHFGSVDDRVRTGLRLYKSIYQNIEVYEAIVRFMTKVPHRASREDYWPGMFTTDKYQATPVHQPYHPKVSVDTVTPAMPGANHRNLQNRESRKVYSPPLCDVWRDVMHRKAEPGDWFCSLEYAIYLFMPVAPQPLDITGTYLKSLQTIEKGIVGKEKLATLVGQVRPD